MMTTSWKLTICLASVVFAAACNGNAEPDARVASLRENIPALEETAKTWRQDAFLDSVELAVLSGEFEPSPISAHFISPSTLQQTLLVTVNADGVISTELVEQTIPVTPSQPITSDEWLLDSPEAFEIALDAKASRFLETNAYDQCSFMVLERSLGSPGEPVVWRVVFQQCLGLGALPQILIDAITGDKSGLAP
jgi:hypothetical protein